MKIKFTKVTHEISGTVGANMLGNSDSVENEMYMRDPTSTGATLQHRKPHIYSKLTSRRKTYFLKQITSSLIEKNLN